MKITKCVTESLKTALLCMLYVEVVFAVKPCKPGTYWDHGTNKCDHCSSICHSAVQQGTEDACKMKCPDFGQKTEQTTPKICQKDWYYDKQIGKCASCGSICDGAIQQGTVDDCNSNCPGFLTGSNYEVEEHETLTQTKRDNLSALEIGLICFVCGGAVVLVTVFLVHKYWKTKRREIVLPNVDDRKYPVPVEDDSDGDGPGFSLITTV